MRQRQEESKRRYSRQTHDEWKALVAKLEALIARLDQPGVWQAFPLPPQTNGDQAFLELDADAGDPKFAFKVVRALDASLVEGLIKEWQAIVKEMEDWEQAKGLVGPRASRARTPPRFNPPLWIPQAKTIKVFEYSAATSWEEPIEDAIGRLNALQDSFQAVLAKNVIDLLSRQSDHQSHPILNDPELRPPLNLLNRIKWILDEKEKIRQTDLLEFYAEGEKCSWWSCLEKRIDIWDSVDDSTQTFLRKLLHSQVDTWLGLTIANRYPVLGKNLFPGIIPTIFYGDDGIRVRKENDAFDFEEVQHDGSPLRIRFKNSRKALSFFLSLSHELIMSEQSLTGKMRIRHPHIQRRIAIKQVIGTAETITMSRNGVFVGDVQSVVRGGHANSADNSNLPIRRNRDVLVRIGKYEICRLSND